MEYWSWGDAILYFVCVFFSFFWYLPVSQFIAITVKLPIFILIELPYRVVSEFTIITFQRRNPDRPYSTFFEFSALLYTRWVLRTFPTEVVRNVFFGEPHARALFALRKFKYGTDNIGDFNYTTVKTDTVRGYWVRSKSRSERKPDLVIYFVPGNMAGCASSYFYIEFLAMLLVELQVQGFRNPAVFCLDLNYCDHYKSGYVSLIRNVCQGWQYVLDEFPYARNCFMGSGSGGTALLSLLLFIARPRAGIGGTGLQKADESISSTQADYLDTASDYNSILSAIDDSTPEIDVPISTSIEVAVPNEINVTVPAEIIVSVPVEINDSIPAEIDYAINENVELVPEEVRVAIPAEIVEPTSFDAENSVFNEVGGSTTNEIDESIPVIDSIPIDNCIYDATDNLGAPGATQDFNSSSTDDPVAGAVENQSEEDSELILTEKNFGLSEEAEIDETTNLLNNNVSTSDPISENTSKENLGAALFRKLGQAAKCKSAHPDSNTEPDDAFDHTKLRRPDSALLISPLSRIVMTRKDQFPDFLTPSALSQLSTRLVKPEEEACLWTMPSYVRDKEWWSDAMPKKGIVLMYGGKETMTREIEHTIATLKAANKARVISVCGDDSIHSWPIVSAYLGRTNGDQLLGITQVANNVAKMLVMDCLYSKHLANC